MGKQSNIVTHTVSVIRNRGQLTIPDSIRALRQWASPNSAVTITSERPDEIIIRPHKKEYDWDKIWEGIRQARAIKGKRGNLSKFIAEDRYRH